MPEKPDYNLVLAPKAQQDLKSIYQYSLVNWGERQAQQYVDGIKACLKDLMDFPQKGRVRDELGPLIRSLNCDKHIVYYREMAEQLQVIRILHGRQDISRHFEL